MTVSIRISWLWFESQSLSGLKLCENCVASKQHRSLAFRNPCTKRNIKQYPSKRQSSIALHSSSEAFVLLKQVKEFINCYCHSGTYMRIDRKWKKSNKLSNREIISVSHRKLWVSSERKMWSFTKLCERW